MKDRASGRVDLVTAPLAFVATSAFNLMEICCFLAIGTLLHIPKTLLHEFFKASVVILESFSKVFYGKLHGI